MESIVLNDWMTTPESHIGTHTIGDDRDTVLHSHEFYEIFYILESSITHVVNGRKEVLQTGDIMILRLSDTHYFIRESGNTCTHRDVVIDPNQFLESCNYIDPALFRRITEAPMPLKAALSFEQIKYFETELNRLVNMTSQPYNTKKSALINVLLAELLGVFLKVEFVITENYPEWLEYLLSRFHMNEFIKDGLDKILEATNMDKSYICRAFKKFTGITMSDHLRQIRLYYAANLLQCTDNTVAHICNDIGISSIPYFNKKFKERFGCSPKEFRKTSRQTAKNLPT